MYKRNERLNLIRKRVDQYGQVAVKDLAIFLQVTPETVRKDLETLENDKTDYTYTWRCDTIQSY